jgi:hypothetical protein
MATAWRVSGLRRHRSVVHGLHAKSSRHFHVVREGLGQVDYFERLAKVMAELSSTAVRVPDLTLGGNDQSRLRAIWLAATLVQELI